MAYPFSFGGSNYVSATELVTGSFDDIQAGFDDVRYPELLWTKEIPPGSVKTDVNPGAVNYVYRARDMKGVGQFNRGSSKNIPRVGQAIGQITVPILDGAVAAEVSNAEARRWQYGYQTALARDFGEIMKLAAQRHVERCFFFGDDAANFASFLDYPTVPLYTPVTAWEGTDPSPWVAEIQAMIGFVYTNSKTVHLPNRVELPPNKFLLLQLPMVIGSGAAGVAMSALEYLKKNNLYTAITGKELEIVSLRYLQGAGAGETDRMIVREYDEKNMVMPFPLEFQLAQPVPITLGVEMAAEYIFGSFNMKFPLSAVMADGI